MNLNNLSESSNNRKSKSFKLLNHVRKAVNIILNQYSFTKLETNNESHISIKPNPNNKNVKILNLQQKRMSELICNRKV